MDAPAIRLRFTELRRQLSALWTAPKFDPVSIDLVNVELRDLLAKLRILEPRQMTDRRFTDKPELHPEAVRSLPPGHPALVENRTLFPNMVVDVDENFAGRL